MPQTENQEVLEQLSNALDSGAFAQIRALLQELHPADTAQLLESIPPDQRVMVWSEVPVSKMGEVLTEVSDGVRDGLLESMDTDMLASAVRTLDVDDIADLAPDLPDDVIADILFSVDKEERPAYDAVLAYPEDTAGGLMNIDTTEIRATITLATVSRYLRLKGELPEYTDKLFVVDRNNRLRGILFMSTLLTNDQTLRVARFMDNDPIKFTVDTPSTEVAASFERYNLISAPVVDEDDRLIGRITVDDVIDVIRETADHSVMVRAGVSEEEDIFAPVRLTARARALWLGVNLITALIASWVIGQFENTIEKLVAVAVLMPIVASMGGNAGMQTLTVVIRGLAVGTISSSNAMRVLRKEFLVGGLNGLIWALAIASVATLWYRDLFLGAIVALAMFINLIASAAAGVVLPMACKRFGIDPALASGVALTTVTDVIGFLSVLGLAALFLV